MPRRGSIKWRDSDVENLRKSVKNFNAKIDRVTKNKPEIAQYQPEKISFKEVKKDITTRGDLNRTINKLTRYSRKGTENVVTSKTGNTVTKWIKKEVSIDVATINRKRAVERKKMENMDVTSQGVSTGLKRAEMGSVRMKQLEPKKYDFDKIRSGKEWEMFVKSVETQIMDSYTNEKNDRYKENYIKGLENNFGEYARDIIDMVKALPSEKVVETFYAEQEATIDFHYSKYEPLADNVKLDILRDIWSNASNG